MSRSRRLAWRWALLVAGWTLGWAPPAVAAQQQVPTAAEYHQRVERLAALWREADRAAQRAESVVVARTGFDSTRVGPITYITRGRASAKEQEGMRLVQEHLEAVVGPGARGLPPFRVFLAQQGVAGPRPAQSHAHIRVAYYSAREPTEVLVGRVISEVSTSITPLLDQALQEWMGSSISLAAMRERDWQREYVNLVTSHALVSRQCFVGSLEACRRALALEPVRAPATDLYDPAGRRWIATRIGEFNMVRPLLHLHTACTVGRSDAACLELLSGIDQRFIARPIWNVAPLLHVAFRLGGAGAFERLFRDTTATIAARLGAAASMPADSLIAAWRDTVLAHRPPKRDVTRRSGWVGFAWILLFVTLATGSTRWRSG